MKIKWLGHASFLIESEGLRIITDPYLPEEVNLPPIEESTDIVIRSSDTDTAHGFIDTLPQGYQLVTATEIVDTGARVGRLEINAVWSQESLIHKEVVRDNAMYRFQLEGINVTHMGDIGNPLTESQLAALEGTDLLFALAGGPPTIELDDLQTAIDAIRPGVVIPMHFRIPGPKFFMQPVTDLTDRYPAAQVSWLNGSEFEITKESFPREFQIIVLEPALGNPSDPA